MSATYSRNTGETVTGGPYTISATLSPAAALTNYAVTYNTAPFTINTKALTITAGDQSKTYGAAFTFAGTEFTSAGLTNGDVVNSVTLASGGAPAAAPVNSYPITASAAAGSGLAN